MASRWHSAAEYAEELDHRLEEIADQTRRAPGAKTDAELQRAKWHATGLEAARELLREVLQEPPIPDSSDAQRRKDGGKKLCRRCGLPASQPVHGAGPNTHLFEAGQHAYPDIRPVPPIPEGD